MSMGHQAGPEPVHASHRWMRVGLTGIAEAVATRDEHLAVLFQRMRQALRLPVSDVAEKLGTTPNRILAMEDGALLALADWPETMRIVTAYAGMLDLDARPILHRIRTQLHAVDVQSAAAHPASQPLSRAAAARDPYARRPRPLRPETPPYGVIDFSAAPSPRRRRRRGLRALLVAIVATIVAAATLIMPPATVERATATIVATLKSTLEHYAPTAYPPPAGPIKKDPSRWSEPLTPTGSQLPRSSDLQIGR